MHNIINSDFEAGICFKRKKEEREREKKTKKYIYIRTFIYIINAAKERKRISQPRKFHFSSLRYVTLYVSSLDVI